MKRFWWLMSVFLGIALIFYGCQEDPVEPISETGSVTFEINAGQVPDGVTSPNGRVSNEVIVEEGMCDIGLAAYARVIVDGEEYVLDIQQWGTDYKTNLLELDPGIHVLTEFVVYDAQGSPLFATPTMDSEFAKFVDYTLPMRFEVLAYHKIENHIDVLCIEEFEPPLFGFKFWDIDLKSVKNLCIFVNYCEPDYGHLVAELTIEIYPDAASTSPEDLIWTGSVEGAGELLCARFPFDPDIPTDQQSYYVVLFINGIQYVAEIDLAFIDAINESESRYLHLNANCNGDIEPFRRTVQIAYEDLLSGGNDMDYNDFVAGIDITGDGEKLYLKVKPLARGAGYEHRFEMVFKKTEVTTNSGIRTYDVGDNRVVVICDETSDLFGGDFFINVACGDPFLDVPVMDIEIELKDDFVYYFDRPLKPCLHTIPGQTPAYNLFLWDWNGDGQSTFSQGGVEYPNGIVIPRDWRLGTMWEWPAERIPIMVGYPDYSGIDSWDPDWYDNSSGAGLYPDCE